MAAAARTVTTMVFRKSGSKRVEKIRKNRWNHKQVAGRLDNWNKQMYQEMKDFRPLTSHPGGFFYSDEVNDKIFILTHFSSYF